VTVGSGIKFLGRIDTAPAGSTYYYYWSEWTRGVFIGDYVYTATSDAVKAADLNDIGGTVWSLGLED